MEQNKKQKKKQKPKKQKLTYPPVIPPNQCILNCVLLLSGAK